MKRILSFALILLIMVTFCSCKPKMEVVSSDGGSYELLTDDDGNRITAANGNPIVAETDADGNSVTKVLKDDYLIISDDEVIAPAYEFEIPEDFEIKSSNVEPMLENKQGTIQQSILDKTKFADDYEKYVEDTFAASKALGTVSEEIETVKINGREFKRFSINTQEDDGTPLVAYCYFIKTNNNRVISVTLTSKDGGLDSVTDADNHIANINFN